MSHAHLNFFIMKTNKISFTSKFDVMETNKRTNEIHSVSIKIIACEDDYKHQSTTAIEAHNIIKDSFNTKGSVVYDLNSLRGNQKYNKSIEFVHELKMNIESTSTQKVTTLKLDSTADEKKAAEVEQMVQEELKQLGNTCIGVKPPNYHSSNSFVEAGIHLYKYTNTTIEPIASIHITAIGPSAQSQYELCNIMQIECMNAIENAPQFLGLTLACPTHAIPGKSFTYLETLDINLSNNTGSKDVIHLQEQSLWVASKELDFEYSEAQGLII